MNSEKIVNLNNNAEQIECQSILSQLPELQSVFQELIELRTKEI